MRRGISNGLRARPIKSPASNPLNPKEILIRGIKPFDLSSPPTAPILGNVNAHKIGLPVRFFPPVFAVLLLWAADLAFAGSPPPEAFRPEPDIPSDLCSPTEADLTTCATNPAQEIRPELSLEEQRARAEQFLNAKLDTWLQQLKLDQWAVTVELLRKGELKRRTLGGIHWDKDEMTAHIEVLDPADYSLPFEEVLADLEFTLVHELVHLELSSLPRTVKSRDTEEQVVNQLAEALLALDRQR